MSSDASIAAFYAHAPVARHSASTLNPSFEHLGVFATLVEGRKVEVEPDLERREALPQSDALSGLLAFGGGYVLHVRCS